MLVARIGLFVIDSLFMVAGLRNLFSPGDVSSQLLVLYQKGAVFQAKNAVFCEKMPIFPQLVIWPMLAAQEILSSKCKVQNCDIAAR